MLNLRSSRFQKTVAIAAMLAAPAMALAHPGHGSAETQGIEAGFFHPVRGADHILAMVAVGLLAVQAARREASSRALWILPASFVSAMAIGAALGMGGVAIPFVEHGILASIFILGAMLTAAFRLPLAASAGLCALMAIFHGHAHGSEAPADASGLTYAIGFMLATSILHLAGIGAGMGLSKLASPTRTDFAVRALGGTIAIAAFFVA